MLSENQAFTVKSYSMQQLRILYGVSEKTFKSWLIKIHDLGEYKGKAYTPAQVQKIVNHLGTP